MGVKVRSQRLRAFTTESSCQIFGVAQRFHKWDHGVRKELKLRLRRHAGMVRLRRRRQKGSYRPDQHGWFPLARGRRCAA